MSLRQMYYGQADGSTVPDVPLTGNPGTDQITLSSAGYLGGVIMALKTSATAGRGTVIVPCDAGNGEVPYGCLISGPGEFAGSIGPSGSGKAPVIRAMPVFQVDNQAYVSGDAFAVGQPVYCGGGANAGQFRAAAATADAEGDTVYTNPVGVCTQVPTAQVPWLGVALYL